MFSTAFVLQDRATMPARVRWRPCELVKNASLEQATARGDVRPTNVLKNSLPVGLIN